MTSRRSRRAPAPVHNLVPLRLGRAHLREAADYLVIAQAPVSTYRRAQAIETALAHLRSAESVLLGVLASAPTVAFRCRVEAELGRLDELRQAANAAAVTPAKPQVAKVVDLAAARQDRAMLRELRRLRAMLPANEVAS